MTMITEYKTSMNAETWNKRDEFLLLVRELGIKMLAQIPATINVNVRGIPQ
jgi:hypothetical protein